MSMKCQSCGMPMSRSPAAGGSEADGGKSVTYCSLCYREGKFIQPNFTATEMQKFCIAKMNEKGVPKFIAWLFTRNIPKLKRWSI